MAATLQLITDSDAADDRALPAAGADVAEVLRAAAAAVDAGGAITDPALLELVQLARRLTGAAAAEQSPTARLAAAHGLSDREREVLELVARGFSVAQMAHSLFLSKSTVTFHLGRIYAKIGVRTRHELSTTIWGGQGRAA